MIGLAIAIRNKRLGDIRDAIDAGGGPAKLCFYGGERPRAGGTAGEKLAECELYHPCAADPEGAMLILDRVEVCESALASGKASWARIVDSKGKFVLDLSVGVGEGDVQLKKSTEITQGMKVEVTSVVIYEGNAG